MFKQSFYLIFFKEKIKRNYIKERKEVFFKRRKKIIKLQWSRIVVTYRNNRDDIKNQANDLKIRNIFMILS